MAHFRILAPASAGTNDDVGAATSTVVDGLPYWLPKPGATPALASTPLRPCPWLGEYIPLARASRLSRDAFSRDALVQPGILCPKCTQLRQSLSGAMSMAETDMMSPSSEGAMLMSFHHHESLRDLLTSSRAGCHLCTIFWQELEVHDYSKSSVAYLKSKLQDSDHAQYLKVCLIQFPDVYKRRRFTYRLDIYDSSGERISFIGLDINNKDDRDNLAENSIARAVRTDSTYHLKQVKQWLRECKDTHQSCHLRMASSNYMPKRIIDLSRVDAEAVVRLTKTQTISGSHRIYAALSYCWGTGKTYSLTEATKASLGVGVHVRDLPQTIRDAIRITLSLGIRYLWVDALCIQQDSISDWNEEAKHMMLVYSNSVLTIAGSGATSCSQGLFGVRDPLLYLPCPLLDIDDHHQVSASVSFSPVISWHSFAALHGRGWVVQERMLAPRTINFGVGVIWECRELLVTDCTTKDLYAGQNDMRKRFAESILSSEHSERQQRDLMKLWYIMLAQYTSSALTYKADRLFAINGIMSSFQKRGLTPWLGLWKPISIWDLMWTVPISYYNDDARKRGLELNDFPSWSWARLNFDVKYELLPYQAPYDDVVFTANLDGNEFCDCLDHEFRCEQRRLVVRAPLIDIDVKPSETQFQKLNRVSHVLGHEVADTATNMVQDDARPEDLFGSHQMLLLIVRKRKTDLYRCAGLVLTASLSSSGNFERMAMADFEIGADLFKVVSRISPSAITLV